MLMRIMLAEFCSLLLFGDTVSLTGTAVGTFDTPSVGTNKTVTVSGQSLTGADALNYSLTEPTTTASITGKTLTVTGITASNKVYDRTTTTTLNVSGAKYPSKLTFGGLP